MMSLNQLNDGAEGRVLRLGGDRTFRRRLMELGFLPGTAVRVIRQAPLGGVMELEVRRARLTLRLSEASQLFVSLG